MAESRGRGGRGAAILKILEEMKQGSDKKEEMKIIQETSRPLTIGRGRSQFLAEIKEKMKEEKPVGRGRGDLIKMLSEMKLKKESIDEKEKKDHPETQKKEQKKKVEYQVPENRRGISGKEISLTTNYIHLKFEKGRGVYEYEVIFTPCVDSLGLRFKILNSIMSEFGQVKTFDGIKLYLPKKLELEITIIDTKHPITEENLKVNIKFKGEKTLGQCIHLLNVLFKKIMIELKYSRALGKPHYYDNCNVFRLPQHRLEIWPGYVTSIAEFEGGVQICCDVSHRLLRTQTIYEYMVDYQFDKKKITQDIIGTSVLTKYNNRLYKIDDIMWDKKPLNSFQQSNGNQITFLEYYKNNYGIEIIDVDQPMLISKAKNRTGEKTELILCLIPELCFLTGLSEDMRKDFQVMKDVAKFTRINPQQRVISMLELFKHINDSSKCKELLKSWGIEINAKYEEIPSRVLVPERIFVGNNQGIAGTPIADWNNALLRNQVLLPVNLNSWAIFYPGKDTNFANMFCQLMYKIGPQIGVAISQAKMISLKNDRIDTYLQAIRSVTQIQLVVVLVPSVREDRYAAIKTLCCVEKPVASQVIISKTLSKPERQKSIVQKIALQINCKLGGALWTVQIPYANTMICGIDTCHVPSQNHASVGAFVASLNNSYSKWFSFTSSQKSSEFLNTLTVSVVTALTKYYENNKRYPDRVVIYRDGISDGMLNVAKEHELPQITSAFSRINAEYNPKLIFIICQKRINTRMFKLDRGLYENPEPGSILDHTVTRKQLYDFFLVSQNVRQGTVTPTHYIVLHDSANTPPDQIQRLTYKMSHLYYNWPGTVRVPAPCQYAHKLSFLVGKYIRRQPSDILSEKLYYI